MSICKHFEAFIILALLADTWQSWEKEIDKNGPNDKVHADPLTHGDPQMSILAPLLFSLQLKPLWGFLLIILLLAHWCHFKTFAMLSRASTLYQCFESINFNSTPCFILKIHKLHYSMETKMMTCAFTASSSALIYCWRKIGLSLTLISKYDPDCPDSLSKTLWWDFKNSFINVDTTMVCKV